jgi:hypothetical protein
MPDLYPCAAQNEGERSTTTTIDSRGKGQPYYGVSDFPSYEIYTIFVMIGVYFQTQNLYYFRY